MSWEFEGRMYHNSAELAEAKSRAAARDAAARVAALSRQADDFLAHSRRLERELGKMGNSLEQTKALNRQLQTAQNEFRRTQQELADSHRRFSQAAEESFADIRAHAVAARQDLDSLDAAHRQHVADVSEMFTQSTAKLAQGLAEVEQRREAGEKQLRTEIAAVDQRLEAERNVRLAQARNDAERGAGLINYTRSRLEELAPRQEELAMRDRVHSLRTGVDFAELELRQGNAASALGIALSTYADLCAAEKEATDRGGELTAARLWAEQTIADVRRQLQDKVLQAYFPKAAPEIDSQLLAIADRIPGVHARWDRKDVRETAANYIDELATLVRQMAASAPSYLEMDRVRRDRIDQVRGRLEQSLGEIAEIDAQGADRRAEEIDNNPLDATILRVHFRNEGVVDLYFPLEATAPVRAEGHGHLTRGACQQSAATISQILADIMPTAAASRVDAQPRAASQLQQPAANTWEGLLDRLATLRSANL
jgi:hypothetical protein